MLSATPPTDTYATSMDHVFGAAYDLPPMRSRVILANCATLERLSFGRTGGMWSTF
jgi:hypothetical protein